MVPSTIPWHWHRKNLLVYVWNNICLIRCVECGRVYYNGWLGRLGRLGWLGRLGRLGRLRRLGRFLKDWEDWECIRSKSFRDWMDWTVLDTFTWSKLKRLTRTYTGTGQSDEMGMSRIGGLGDWGIRGFWDSGMRGFGSRISSLPLCCYGVNIVYASTESESRYNMSIQWYIYVCTCI